MLSVGEKLKRARIAQSLDLSLVAAQTKISPKYLEAIEADDRQKFPSGFFYKSFVDQYARFLSLDTEDIDVEIDRLLSTDAPMPLPDANLIAARRLPPIRAGHRLNIGRWIGSAATLVIVIAGCAGVSVVWHKQRSALTALNARHVLANVRTFTNSIFDRTAQAKTTAPKEVEPEQSPGSVPAAEPPSLEKPSPPESSADTEAPVLESAAIDDAERDSASAQANVQRTQSSAPILVEVVAHEPTWLSLASDGKTAFSGTLQPDESKTLNGKESAKMRVGNAAGIEIRFNGKRLGALGARGQVITVQFTAGNFQIVTPPNTASKQGEESVQP